MYTLTARYRDALAFAFEKHAGQVRKASQTPYLGHPLRVSGMVMEWAESEDEVIAALLHDVAEDCGGLAVLEEIRQRFGETVARLVEQCSDSLVADPTHKAPWRQRKEAFIARARTADPAAQRVMLCDKIDNSLATLERFCLEGDSAFRIFKTGREILWYFHEMYDALKDSTPPALAERYRRILDELPAS